jgi:hypothetical protein
MHDTYYISICKLCEWNYHTTVVIASPWKEDTYELYGTIYFSIDKKYHISCFLSGLPWLLLRRKLMNQGLLMIELKSSRRQFYHCHDDLVKQYLICVSQICSVCCNHISVLFPFMTTRFHYKVKRFWIDQFLC